VLQALLTLVRTQKKKFRRIFPSSYLQPHLADTPHTPMTPSGEGRKRKANPLNDLIDTEKVYVDQLTGIIRVRVHYAYLPTLSWLIITSSRFISGVSQKVASAWSRSNLPPPELDKMFRGVEAVYKANRALGQVRVVIVHSLQCHVSLADCVFRTLQQLNDIGVQPDQANPKALGDLLMRWVCLGSTILVFQLNFLLSNF
jgi:hypothetical protein